MHMADALISPIVGGSMFLSSSGIGAYSMNRIKDDLDMSKVPLMGVMGAFIFTAQMINFTIPGTGSSGHIGGALLLSILLGPYAGFLTLACVLFIQAFFFADGGILALGCNLFNMGFYTCFVAYPLIYKAVTKKDLDKNRIIIGTVLSSIVGLQMGAFSVVMQTLISGKTELPFLQFTVLMQGIHLLIGLIEGLITASIVIFIWHNRPEILEKTSTHHISHTKSMRNTIIGFFIVAMITGSLFSWYASSKPDGLEWALENAKIEVEDTQTGGLHSLMSSVQEKTSILPDYGFKTNATNVGTSVSGIVGGLFTLLLILGSVKVTRYIKIKTSKQ